MSIENSIEKLEISEPYFEENIISRLDIERKVEEIISLNKLGSDLSFRDGQADAIATIVESIVNGKKHTLLDAPTGTGKSLIAISSSLILSDIGKKGYIIASDLGLQHQYENDFEKFGLDWGSVKGVDNYMCNKDLENEVVHSLGYCKARRIKPSTMPCYQTCPYFSSRTKAINSPVSLLNYSYWLIHQNFVNRHLPVDRQPFPKRNFIFFDEAHKADMLVAEHFAPKIDSNLGSKMIFCSRQLRNFGIYVPTLSNFPLLYKDLKMSPDKGLILSHLKFLENQVTYFKCAYDQFEDLTNELFGELPLSPLFMTLRSHMELFKDIDCKLEDYIEIVEAGNINSITRSNQPGSVKFYTTEMGEVMMKCFHRKYGKGIFMTATPGKFENFKRCINLRNDTVHIKLDNKFDHSLSKMYVHNSPKLTYDKRDVTKWDCLQEVDKVINLYPNVKGIIHTSSYNFSDHIKNESIHSERFLTYNGSKEKREILKIFKESDNKILMGPSLLEGLNFSDSDSRFQIFFKAPYLNLSSEWIRKMMHKSKTWYLWKTSINVIQGCGRSIRHPEDWANTHFIDGCFKILISRYRKHFPKEFLDQLELFDWGDEQNVIDNINRKTLNVQTFKEETGFREHDIIGKITDDKSEHILITKI